MKINVPNLKKKVAKRFDEVVKKATERAVPIVRKETIGKLNLDAVVPVLFTVAIGIGLSIATKTPTPSTPHMSAETIIHIETLNLYVS